MLNLRFSPDPILKVKCKPLLDSEFADIKYITDIMFSIMQSNRGVGLAAPQVGYPRRLFITKINNKKQVFINPEILSAEGVQTGMEGCLSFPDLWIEKSRPQKVTIKAQNLDKEWFEITGEGLLARALIHEFEHLEGKLFIE